ncbi:hypothetical protein [Sulfuriroseicoccus oceanibius]|uniref:Uncharacterized protein n=1 Tax=Sulfuriroseicoccus oceanibius TaxID=2707525 RepID=A0A6B3LBR7_9BACT|nr:hypothetical protein [Sulfuriroseicoccus oceanibius]QQL44598.1 hypothetical protein G3M56_012005 [Sulfuriroseicoccus oceanibius]
MKLITLLASFGALAYSSCVPYRTSVQQEQILATRGDEVIVEKTIRQDMIVLANPDGGSSGHLHHDKYYLKKGEKETPLKKLSIPYMDAPYKKFYPISGSNRWVYVAQKIASAGRIDNHVVVFNESKVYDEFEVNNCKRNQGDWGVSLRDDKIVFFGERELTYNPTTNQFEN